MSSALHVVRAGVGPRVVLVHGSATDRTSWSLQLSQLRDHLELVAYDRRAGELTVEDHAADAAELLGGQPGLVIGSSFGAVVALELIRSDPRSCAGAVLIEPPIAAADELPAAAAAFLGEFDRCVEQRGGPAAAELFLRMVLGDVAFDRIPQAFQDRSTAKWLQIRHDSAALISYRPRYAELGSIDVPVLLLGGERSTPYFRATLEALRVALPRARLEIVPAAGHMLHAEAHRRFGELVTAFAAEVGLAPR